MYKNCLIDYYLTKVSTTNNNPSLGVTPNSRRFNTSIAGAWFDSQSHSWILAGCYDHAIFGYMGVLNVRFFDQVGYTWFQNISDYIYRVYTIYLV